jgi:xylose isomerase
MTLSMYHVIRVGGLGQSGNNFDVKVRRQSIEPEDLIHAHIGAWICARANVPDREIYEEGRLESGFCTVTGWQTPDNLGMLNGDVALESIAARAE